MTEGKDFESVNDRWPLDVAGRFVSQSIRVYFIHVRRAEMF